MTGEGEFSMRDLVNGIINNQNIDKIPGLVKKIGNKKYIINPATRIHDLNVVTRPARYMVNMEGYFKIGAFHSAKSRSKRVLNVMCSRGCPENVLFVPHLNYGAKKMRWRTTEHIMNEIKNDVKIIKSVKFNLMMIQLRLIKKLFALCKELKNLDCHGAHPTAQK